MSISAKIEALPSLRSVVEQHGLWADKRFGQNYLFDLNLTAKIARSATTLTAEHTVFEIGPGPGGLTRPLLSETKAKRVIALEMDPRFITALEPLVEAAEGRLLLIETNALKADLLALAPAPRAVIANLPYNVGTELLINWLHHAQEFSEFILMFQREVADRLVAKPNTKDYGRLSVLAQALCHCQMLFTVPPGAFTPPPKVTSAIVKLVPKNDSMNIPIKALERLTAAAFGQRRKMLRQSLKALPLDLTAQGINPEARAEDLTVQDYIRLAHAYAQVL